MQLMAGTIKKLWSQGQKAQGQHAKLCGSHLGRDCILRDNIHINSTLFPGIPNVFSSSTSLWESPFLDSSIQLVEICKSRRSKNN